MQGPKRHTAAVLIAIVALTVCPALVAAADLNDAASTFLVLEFQGQGTAGRKLADSVQVRLRRQATSLLPDAYVVSWIEIENQLGGQIDTLSGGLPETLPQIARRLGLAEGQNLYVLRGTLTDKGRAEVELFSHTDGQQKHLWQKRFSASSERWLPLLSQQIVEAVLQTTGVTRPPPASRPAVTWGRSILPNGDFQTGGEFPAHWARPDGLCTFWGKSPDGNGLARFDTDVSQDQALEWWKAIEAGADPCSAPKPIRTQPPHYDAVGGNYGASLYSDWIEIKPPCRLRLSADVRGPRNGQAKIFVKGYALLPKGKEGRTERREIWQTYLQCDTDGGPAKVYAAEFEIPGKPAQLSKLDKTGERQLHRPQVQWLRLMLYAYWPVGIYEFDNVLLQPAKPLEKQQRDHVQTRPHAQHGPHDGQPQQQ
ncbi:MAG: hypothetical protein GXY33_11580 [Phycisphaerae bacterium]|nr:hypothetical protein [Phycisphaerae bacterium]